MGRDAAVPGRQQRVVGRRGLDRKHIQAVACNAAVSSALARAGSSTRGPRLVLIRNAVGFIQDSRWALTR